MELTGEGEIQIRIEAKTTTVITSETAFASEASYARRALQKEPSGTPAHVLNLARLSLFLHWEWEPR